MNEPLPWLYTCKSSSVGNVIYIGSVRWMDLAGAFVRFKAKMFGCFERLLNV